MNNQEVNERIKEYRTININISLDQKRNRETKQNLPNKRKKKNEVNKLN